MQPKIPNATLQPPATRIKKYVIIQLPSILLGSFLIKRKNRKANLLPFAYIDIADASL